MSARATGEKPTIAINAMTVAATIRAAMARNFTMFTGFTKPKMSLLLGEMREHGRIGGCRKVEGLISHKGAKAQRGEMRSLLAIIMVGESADAFGE